MCSGRRQPVPHLRTLQLLPWYLGTTVQISPEGGEGIPGPVPS